jgi:hypothetical protein
MNFQDRYEDTDTAEIITLIGTEADGTLRVRYSDGIEDVMPQAVLDYQFIQVDEDDFGDDPEDVWTAEDEAGFQARQARKARQLAAAHAQADREWMERTGRQRPGCGCPDLPVAS